MTNHLLSARLQEREEVISEMVFHNVPARLANLLVKLAEEHGVQTEEGIKIDTKLSIGENLRFKSR